MQPKRALQRLGLIGMGLLLVVSVLVLAELCLRLFDYGRGGPSYDPLAGFSASVPLFELAEREDGTAVYRVSPLRLTNPESPDALSQAREFVALKPPDAFRVFVVGGSSAAGYPYPPDLAFAAWAEHELRAHLPQVEVEFVNAAVAGYGTRRVLPVVRELTRYEPDLLIVYSGHNEWAERRFYSHLIEMHPALFRLRERLIETRLFTLFSRLTSPQLQDPDAALRDLLLDQDSEFREMFAVLSERAEGSGYPSPEQRAQRDLVYRANLETIVRTAHEIGARVLLLGLAQNLSDWAPGASSHRPGLAPELQARWDKRVKAGDRLGESRDCPAALGEYAEALKIDAEYASLHYRVARCHQRLGDLRAAREHFTRASDLDRVPHGAGSGISDIVQDVARQQDTVFLDTSEVLERANGEAIMGDDLFIDWAHPRLRAHQVIGSAIVARLRDEGIPHPSEDWTKTRWSAPDPDTLYAADPGLRRREHEARLFLCSIARRPDCVAEQQRALRDLRAP